MRAAWDYSLGDKPGYDRAGACRDTVMDAATFKEWLATLAPWAGIAVAIWTALRTHQKVAEVKVEIDGRMDELRRAYAAQAAADIAADRAAALRPENVQAARDAVVDAEVVRSDREPD